MWRVRAGNGRHVLACWGKAVRGEVLLGVVWQVWQVKVAQVVAWSGVAGEVSQGSASQAMARQGKSGQARCVKARHGTAWQAGAMYGMAGMDTEKGE